MSLLNRISPVAALMLLCVAAPSAQEIHPDLSGTWVLNLAKSKLGKHPTISSDTVVIIASESKIEIRETVDGKEETHSYVIDGKEYPYASARVSQSVASENVTKASWKKTILMIEDIGRVRTSGVMGDAEVLHQTDRWTLSPDGKTLSEKTSSSGMADAAPSQLFVYDKQ
jgi:hypothetical protein